MGVLERKEREKQELRELILRTASKQFAEHGFDKVSMRSIAREIEYSPTTIYLYFKDKNELLYAMSEKAFGEFNKYLVHANVEKDAISKLRRLGREYVRFGLECPDYYDLMFIRYNTMMAMEAKESWDLGMNSHKLLSSTVEACQQEGYFAGKDPDILSFMIWSFVHGVVTMHIRNRMRMYPENEHQKFIDEAGEMFSTFLRMDKV